MPFDVRDRLFIGDINDAAEILQRGSTEVTHVLSLLGSASISFFSEWRSSISIPTKEIREVFVCSTPSSSDDGAQKPLVYSLELAGPEFKLVRMAVPLRDTENENLLDYLDVCLDFIDESRKGGGSVLVHCFAGVSGSAAVVTAYLMRTERLSREDALESLRQSREFVCPNDGFLEQLKVFEDMSFKVDHDSTIYKRFHLKVLGDACNRGEQIDSSKLGADPGLYMGPVSNEDKPTPAYCCKKYRRVVALEGNVISHIPGEGETCFESQKRRSGNPFNRSDEPECSSIFVEPLRWMKTELSMDSQNEGIDPSVDLPEKRKYGKSIRWTAELNRHFIEYVAEEVRKGNKKNNSLVKEGWKTVKERFLNELGIFVNNEQLRNHFDKTRRLWQGWRYLNAQTGLGWNEKRQTYTASDSFWEGFKKMYKDGHNLRWKGLDNEEEQLLQTIYGGSAATSEDRWNPSSGIVPPNEDEQDLDIDEIKTKQIPPSAGPQLGPRPHASTPSSLCQRRTRRRQKLESSTSASMSRACDLMEERTKVMERVMAPKSHEEAERVSYKKCMQLLEELPTFNPLNAMYTWAPSFLLDKGKRFMFISMSNIRLREGWLKREYEKSNSA